MPSGQACIYARSSGPKQKETSISEAARDGVSQERRKNMGEMAGEARFSREMAAARGLIGDPAQARRDSPDPGRRHDGRGHPAAIFGRRAGRGAAAVNEPRASDSIDLPSGI